MKNENEPKFKKKKRKKDGVNSFNRNRAGFVENLRNLKGNEERHKLRGKAWYSNHMRSAKICQRIENEHVKEKKKYKNNKKANVRISTNIPEKDSKKTKMSLV